MVEALTDMPAGTIGFSFVGRVNADDYRDVIVPALKAAVEAGDVRAVFVIGPEYEGFDMGALREDLKGIAPLGMRHRDAWKRLAAVTDTRWMVEGVKLFEWLMPGRERVFAVAELEDAKRWVAEG